MNFIYLIKAMGFLNVFLFKSTEHLQYTVSNQKIFFLINCGPKTFEDQYKHV